MAPLTHTPSARNAPIRLLVLHGQLLVADVLAAALEAQPRIQIVGVETRPAEAVDHARQVWPDVVVIQYSTEWIQVATTLSAELRGVNLVMLVPSVDHDVLLACAQAGAVGYLTLDQPLTDLAVAVSRVHSGEVLFDARLMRDLLVRSARVRVSLGANAPLQTLAPRELEVLQTLATGVRLDEAGDRLGISVHTVRSHMRKIMDKLDARTRLEAVVTAVNAGLIELPRESSPRPFDDDLRPTGTHGRG
jgi:DNA-binding NarL/FixJ family response regulator